MDMATLSLITSTVPIESCLMKLYAFESPADTVGEFEIPFLFLGLSFDVILGKTKLEIQQNTEH